MNRQRLYISLFLALLAALFIGGGLWLVGVLRTGRPDYENPQIEVVVDGLLAPIGMAELADGGLLVAESGTGENDHSAGVSLITAEGRAGRLVSGFESTRDSGDLAGVPLVQLSPYGDTVYIGNFDQGHIWTLSLTAEQQQQGLTLPAVPLSTAELTPAMLPLNRVSVLNPFDMAFGEDGVPIVTDATGDGVAKETPAGKTQFIHRFARYPDPTADDKRVTLSPVPTGIARIGEEYYVTLTGGCPYPPGGGKLVAIDEDRNERVILDRLNMPIDIAEGSDGTLWLLEFATFKPDGSCFDPSSYQARTGRLSRLLPDGTLDPVLDDLNFPGAVLPLADGSLYVTEVYPGRVLHVSFSGQPSGNSNQYSGANERPELVTDNRLQITDFDKTLQDVIQARQLKPRPGAGEREGNTPLAELGKMLFFDPILSGDKNASCATCHHPSFAGADGRVLPIGTGGEGVGPERMFVEEVTLAEEASEPRRLAGRTDPDTGVTVVHNPFVGQFVPRNSPTIINTGLFPSQFWDSRVELVDGVVRTLEDEVNKLAMTDPLAVQALFPLTSNNEMAGATLADLPEMEIRNILLDRLRANPTYIDLFRTAFGEAPPEEEAISLERYAEAVAAFERQLIFTDAPWDSYLAGDSGSLSEEQKRGALLFFGQIDPAVNCSACHSGDLFSDFQHHNLLAPQLGPGKGHDYTGREDWGRAGASFNLQDRYRFRTPSLRNVELTPPYLHDGAYPTLTATIRHHADIWTGVDGYDPVANAIPADLFSSMRPFLPEKQAKTVAPLLQNGLPLNDADIADLVTFLTALTDPAARDLSTFMPDAVPSGLPLDPMPSEEALATYRQRQALSATEGSEVGDQRSEIRDRQSEVGEETTGNGLIFRDAAEEVGLDFRHGAFRNAIFDDPAAAMSGGLCWIDFDNDGWLDLYFVNTYVEDEADFWQENGGLPRNALFRNIGGTFEDVSTEAGADLALRGNGCLAADFDNDGWTDMLITADGSNALLWNNGDGTFDEGAAAAGLDASEWNSAAVAGDLNGDGWLDLFVAGFIDLEHQVPKPAGLFPQDYYGLPDHLFISTGISEPGGKPTYREVTETVGLIRQERGLGALFSDLDMDGDLDLYIANDGHPNRLYGNEPWPGGIKADPERIGFRFIDLTETAEVGDSGSGMGVSGGDWDGDGLIDLVVTNWERELNALYRNEGVDAGNLNFQYSTFRIGMMGLGNNQTGWGVHWADFDHDTDTDLLIVNGRVPVTNLDSDRQGVRFYRNRTRNADGSEGRAGQFFDFSKQVGLGDIGPYLARGSARADYDNDGDLDVAVNTIAGNAVLLQNDGAPGHWLSLDLGGMYPGARAELDLPDGRTLVREVYAGSSYLATEDARLHFGLGPFTSARVKVVFGDGRVVEMGEVEVDRMLAIALSADDPN